MYPSLAFSDFQCPFLKIFYPALHPDKVLKIDLTLVSCGAQTQPPETLAHPAFPLLALSSYYMISLLCFSAYSDGQ